MTDTCRRVKVYTRDEDRPWDDLGTGHVSVGYVEDQKGLSVIVRDESDGSLLLESKIEPNNTFHKQEETLIMWSEDKIYDAALSFQHKAVCDEIWEKIRQVQEKKHSEDIVEDVLDKSDEERVDDWSSPSRQLPPCKLNHLEDLEELLASSLPSLLRRERLALALEEEGYIHKLVDLFRVCEDLDNQEGLHHLYEIIKGIFLLNRRALFEIMFSDECIMDIIGCLEFDPELTQPLRHREFLSKKAQFKEVIPISDPDLCQIIHQTYRVQYIQDTVLPAISCFQENVPSALHSFICFNKVEIVGMIQQNQKLLTDLFAQLADVATEDDRKRNLVDFLKEFCTLSQTLQSQHRRAFFKTLSKKGILPTLEVILRTDDARMRGAATDILSDLVECNPSMVQEFVMLESKHNADGILLINLIIDRVTCDPDLVGAEQLMGLLQTLVDPENMPGGANKTRQTEFLNFFYENCMHLLSAPLLANTTDGQSNNDFQTCQLLALILELLTFCVEHHTYHIRNYIINNDLLSKVLVLTVSQHTFLALSSLRFMRRIIGLKDEIYNRYIMRNFLFEPVIKAFLENGSRYNLMNSAIIEMFEYIRVEKVKSLTAHIVENYWKSLEGVDYVQTFRGLKVRYEKQLQREEKPKLDQMRPILRNHHFHRDAQTRKYEKEIGFKGDEDHFKFSKVVVLPCNKMNSKEELMESIKKFMERKELVDSKGDKVLGESSSLDWQKHDDDISFSRSPKTNFSSLPSSASIKLARGSPNSPDSWAQSSTSASTVTTKGGLVGLVDYLDDEEEGEVKEDPLPPSKKSKMSS